MADYDIQLLNGNDFLITQFYGENASDYAQFGLPFHIGIDFVSQSGQDWNIEAVKGGKILYAGWKNGGYGNVVIILQDDNVLSKYMHLDSVFVSVNDEVKQGQEIGVIGNTGNSTGRHCHIECSTYDGNMWSINNHFDPIPYFNRLDDEAKAKPEPTPETNYLFDTSIEAIKEIQSIYPDYYDNWGRAFGNTDMAKQNKEALIWIREMCDQISWKINGLKENNLFLSTEKTAAMSEVKKANNQISELISKHQTVIAELNKPKVSNDNVKSMIDEAIKTAPSLMSITSTDRKWYQSKKFWALILGLGANVGMILYPTQSEMIMSLNALFAVYLTGQSVIDYNNK